MKFFSTPFAALTALFICATALPPLHAQSQEQDQEEAENDRVEDIEDSSRRRFWQANVSNGHYMVALDRISNISMHEYVLDGSLVINEVTIDTTGRAIARFYHIQPVTDSMGRTEVARMADKGREMIDRAASRAGSAIHDMAQKNYPTTTHAGMIEYRILHKQDLDALYNSLRAAWVTGKGRKFTIK